MAWPAHGSGKWAVGTAPWHRSTASSSPPPRCPPAPCPCWGVVCNGTCIRQIVSCRGGGGQALDAPPVTGLACRRWLPDLIRAAAGSSHLRPIGHAWPLAQSRRSGRPSADGSAQCSKAGIWQPASYTLRCARIRRRHPLQPHSPATRSRSHVRLFAHPPPLASPSRDVCEASSANARPVRGFVCGLVPPAPGPVMLQPRVRKRHARTKAVVAVRSVGCLSARRAPGGWE